MEKSVLMKKIHMECPLCDKYHELEERLRTATIVVKEEEVSYEEMFYFCANSFIRSTFPPPSCPMIRCWH